MNKCNMILPKLWLQRIPRFWDKTVPQNYPQTSSEFSLKFDSENINEAVKTMEEKLNTTESIVTEDMISDGQLLGNYLGTYDVTGVAGELVLISPEKVSNSTVGVLAFHYNETNNTWEKIEDAQIIDGYVYGTLNSFSPISVFTIKRDTMYYETHDYNKGGALYVANGIPITIIKNENGEIVVKDANGKETIVPEKTGIVGGSIDGTDVASTSVFAKGVLLKYIFGGSIGTPDVSVKVNKVSVTVEDCEMEDIVAGRFNCKTEESIFNIKNSKLEYFGTGASIFTSLSKKDCNKKENLGLSSNAWAKNSIANIENTDIEVLCAGGITGNFYNHNSELNIKGGNFKYVTTGGTNGKSGSCKINVSDANIEIYQGVNRGIVEKSNATITNCNIKTMYVTSSSNPSVKETGIITDSVRLDITGGNITLYVGNMVGEAVTSAKAHEIIESFKISRTTEVVYGDSATLSILGDIIRIK